MNQRSIQIPNTHMDYKRSEQHFRNWICPSTASCHKLLLGTLYSQSPDKNPILKSYSQPLKNRAFRNRMDLTLEHCQVESSKDVDPGDIH